MNASIFCCEVGPTGNSLLRLITSVGYPCDVVSLTDPGIANWIDTAWAGEEASSVEFATVPLAKFDRHLGDVPRIGPEERRVALAERTRLFNHRRWR